MKERNFRQLLEDRWASGTAVCVGLDSDYEKIPKCITQRHHDVFGAILEFNRNIISATQDLVCAYKINSAFYEKYGAEGWKALWNTITYSQDAAPSVPVILDGKRADIGNTNEGYVISAFDDLRADAITVHPYLGREAMKPFLDRKNKGIIVLCKTSNPGSGEFQDRMVSLTPKDAARFQLNAWTQIPMYEYVAYSVATTDGGWNANGNCCLVVGATYPEQLAQVREIVGNMPILIPGIGAQGGDLKDTVNAGKDSRGRGMIINSSRGIIFASAGEDFAEAARRETLKLRDAINACLAE